MLKVGFVGWRGMVGSVLMQRMSDEDDFNQFHATFFSTSNIGGDAPQVKKLAHSQLQDAYDLELLLAQDCIVTAFGSAYTQKVLPELRARGFNGYWLDASSSLRMNDDTIIVLDPVNREIIDAGLKTGIKNFCGGNCTVSLMLMGLSGLFKQNLVEWVHSSTYQSVSGAGANNILELLMQTGMVYNSVANMLDDAKHSILQIESQVSRNILSPNLPTKYFGAPLVGNVLPWIDEASASGQTKEEWKGIAETNKILGLAPASIKVDGICVRVGSLRCHSQSIMLKLTDPSIPLDELTNIIKNANQWVKVVPNTKSDTLKYLTPAAISGSREIAVGRIHKLNMGAEYLSVFTVGDQLLWGAAEPLRRMLNILVKYCA